MADRTFIDTNVLVYSLHRGDEPHKSARAIEVLTLLRNDGRGYVSAQIIAEFVSVACRKLNDTLGMKDALRAAELLTDQFRLVALDDSVVREALRASGRYGLDYFDAQVWATARISGCQTLLTEDVHGEALEGIRFLNPFAEDFRIEGL